MRPSPERAAHLTEREARELRPDLVRAYADKGWRIEEIARALHVCTRTIDRDIVRLRERDGWQYRPELKSRKTCASCGVPASGERCRRCHQEVAARRIAARHDWLVTHREMTHRQAGEICGVSDETIRVDRRTLRNAGRLPDCAAISYRFFDDSIVERHNAGEPVHEIVRHLGLPEPAVQSRVDALRGARRISRRNSVRRERFRAELADLLTDRTMHGAPEAAARRGWTSRRLGKRIRDLRRVLAA